MRDTAETAACDESGEAVCNIFLTRSLLTEPRGCAPRKLLKYIQEPNLLFLIVIVTECLSLHMKGSNLVVVSVLLVFYSIRSFAQDTGKWDSRGFRCSIYFRCLHVRYFLYLLLVFVHRSCVHKLAAVDEYLQMCLLSRSHVMWVRLHRTSTLNACTFTIE